MAIEKVFFKTGTGVTLSENGLVAEVTNSNYTAVANIGRNTGKWYFEFLILTTSTSPVSNIVGVVGGSHNLTATSHTQSTGRFYWGYNGNKYPEATAYGSTYTLGDTIGVFLNLDEGSIRFYKNGVTHGVSHTNLSTLGTVFPANGSGGSSVSTKVRANFGDSDFAYLPSDLPEGTLSYNGDSLNKGKILLKSNNKIYSLKSEEILHETKMTSNTTPAPFVASASSASASYPAYKAFNGIFNSTSDDSWNSVAGVTNAWVQIDYSTPRKVNAVVLKNRWLSNASASTTPYTSPKDFDILGSNDGVDFRLLKSERGLAKWGNGEVKTFTLNNVANFRYYRVHVLNGNNDSGNASYNTVSLAEIEFLYVEALTELPIGGLSNFIKYGASVSDSQYFGLIHGSKNYILQDTVSENADGLWMQEIDRKPLSIKFK